MGSGVWVEWWCVGVNGKCEGLLKRGVNTKMTLYIVGEICSMKGL